MTWRRAAAKYLAKLVVDALVGNALAHVGDEVGTAIGNRIARKIDPEHGKDAVSEDDESDSEDADETSEPEEVDDEPDEGDDGDGRHETLLP